MLIGNYSVLNKSPGRFLSGSSAAGAGQGQSRANWSKTGPLRGVHYQDGATAADKLWGAPEGAVLMPYTQGMMTSRYEAVLDLATTASAVMGYPISGGAALSLIVSDAAILPGDDSSPLRTGTATFEVTAEATGEMKSSGSGAATLSITVTDAVLVGIFDGSGQSDISITTNNPTLGAEASGTGQAVIGLVAFGWLLPLDDTSPARTAMATISMGGSLVPYAVGNMIGNALPYTELSPQSLANAVWQAPATENNLAGSMGSKVNTASSGGVDLAAMAEAVWGYEQ